MIHAQDLKRACIERPDAMVVLCYEDDAHLPDWPLCFSLQGMRIQHGTVLLVSMPVEAAGTMRGHQVLEHLQGRPLPDMAGAPVWWENQHPPAKVPIAARKARVVHQDTRDGGKGRALRFVARRESSS